MTDRFNRGNPLALNMALKTYRKQAIDENRYAAVILMRTVLKDKSGIGNRAAVNDLNPSHLTLMTSQAGCNLSFSSHGGVMYVALNLKGYKFTEKWSTLTDMDGKVREGFNVHTGERYCHPPSYNSLWATITGFNARVDALLAVF